MLISLPNVLSPFCFISRKHIVADSLPSVFACRSFVFISPVQLSVCLRTPPTTYRIACIIPSLRSATEVTCSSYAVEQMPLLAPSSKSQLLPETLVFFALLRFLAHLLRERKKRQEARRPRIEIALTVYRLGSPTVDGRNRGKYISTLSDIARW